MSDWIKCSDRLPKKHKNVLISVKIKNRKKPETLIGFYAKENDEDGCFVLDDDVSIFELNEVTHWQ